MPPNINFSLSQQLGRLLESKKLKLALAESCTGGGIAEEITAVFGSSAWFECGFVTYSNTAKMELLDVKQETLTKHGAVSETTAQEMAIGAINHSHADISLSITGIAGPDGGSKEKPVGTVCFAIAFKDGTCESQRRLFSGGRKQVRTRSIQHALSWLLEAASNA